MFFCYATLYWRTTNKWALNLHPQEKVDDQIVRQICGKYFSPDQSGGLSEQHCHPWKPVASMAKNISTNRKEQQQTETNLLVYRVTNLKLPQSAWNLLSITSRQTNWAFTLSTCDLILPNVSWNKWACNSDCFLLLFILFISYLNLTQLFNWHTEWNCAS